jgi:8-oxo-dGTP pyrophosphatase MutT (NUDIX family)
MTFDVVLQTLTAALARPLPGPAAQDALAPAPRRDWPEGLHAAKVRHAAGLLLLFPIDNRAHVLFTVRAGALGRHGGQVSLPGGVVEPGETLEEAALREAHEEVALRLDEVRVLGALTPLDIPISGFRLYPVVAAQATRPTLTASRGEVARILEVAVADLRDPAHLRPAARRHDGKPILVPAFHVAGEEIWGATAMVLAEFLALLGWPGPPSERSRLHA